MYRKGLRLTLQFLEKPGAGVCPKKVCTAWRNAERLGRFLDCEPHQVAELDQFGWLGIDHSQLFQSLMQRQALIRALRGGFKTIHLEPDPIPAAFEAVLLPSIFD